jgi:hypothetical protein
MRKYIVAGIAALALTASVPAVADAHYLSTYRAKQAISNYARDVAMRTDLADEVDDWYADSCNRWSGHKVWCIANIEGYDYALGESYTCIGGAYATIRPGSYYVRVRGDGDRWECF